MAATVYAPLLGDTNVDQVYTSATPSRGFYPVEAQVTMLGPIVTPRIYGENLTTFEIASSGTIDMTVDDIRTLRISRSGQDVSLETPSADSLIVASSNNITLSSTGQNVFTAGSSLFKTAAGVDILTIETDTPANVVTVHGNLNVTGVINSVTVTENKLEVADKTIVLAHNVDVSSTISDGVGNTGAGIVVAGMPSEISDQTAASNVEAFEKSIKWHHDSNVENYWELKGGSFRMTSNMPTNDWAVDGEVTGMDNVSYVMRINSQKALEFVKYTGSNVEVVARFGAVVA